MSSGESVTQWIDRLKGGDRACIERLLKRYFEQLVRKTHGWLRHTPHQATDAEDIALNAFDSVCRRAAACAAASHASAGPAARSSAPTGAGRPPGRPP